MSDDRTQDLYRVHEADEQSPGSFIDYALSQDDHTEQIHVYGNRALAEFIAECLNKAYQRGYDKAFFTSQDSEMVPYEEATSSETISSIWAGAIAKEIDESLLDAFKRTHDRLYDSKKIEEDSKGLTK